MDFFPEWYYNGLTLKGCAFMVFYTMYPSPAGVLRLESDGENLTGLYFSEEGDTAQYVHQEVPVFAAVRSWLDSYFRGAVLQTDFSIRLKGTAFQLQVWEILQSIPWGQTVTYGDIAREMALRLGKEKMSAQAVGQAVGRNPVSIIIPCHRVVGAGQRLTGYAGGVDKKLWLLRHEGWKGEGKV